MKLNDLGLRQVDLVMLFVFGFAFLIVAINPLAGIGYLGYIISGGLVLMFLNALNKSGREIKKWMNKQS